MIAQGARSGCGQGARQGARPLTRLTATWELFSDAERTEQFIEEIFGRYPADDLLQSVDGSSEMRGRELHRHLLPQRGAKGGQLIAGATEGA